MSRRGTPCSLALRAAARALGPLTPVLGRRRGRPNHGPRPARLGGGPERRGVAGFIARSSEGKRWVAPSVRRGVSGEGIMARGGWSSRVRKPIEHQ